MSELKFISENDRLILENAYNIFDSKPEKRAILFLRGLENRLKFEFEEGVLEKIFPNLTEPSSLYLLTGLYKGEGYNLWKNHELKEEMYSRGYKISKTKSIWIGPGNHQTLEREFKESKNIILTAIIKRAIDFYNLSGLNSFRIPNSLQKGKNGTNISGQPLIKDLRISGYLNRINYYLSKK